jgi:hypothetical protein
MADYAFRLNRQHIANVAPDLTHSLDYLGVVVGNPLPTDEAALTLMCERQGTWLDYKKVNGKDGTFAGVMAMRKDLFLDHLQQALSKTLRRETLRLEEENRQLLADGKLKHPEADFLKEIRFQRNGNSLLLQGGKNYEWTHSDVKNNLTKEVRLEVKLTEGNEYKISGLLHTYLKRDRTTDWNKHSIAESNRNTEFGGTMSLLIAGAGAKCSVVPSFNLTFTPLRKDDDDTGNTSAFEQFFTGINNTWDRRVAGDWLSDSRNAIVAMLKGVFSDVNLGVTNFAFIPPGEETFLFRQPQLNEHLDLIIDVTYRGV